MEKYMKKIFNVLTLLCLAICVILAFASCGGNSTDNSSQSSVTDNSVQTDTSSSQNNDGSSVTDSSNTDNSSTDNSSTDSSVPSSADDGTNDDKPQAPTEITYKVKAVDAFGNTPDSTVIVCVFKDGEEIIQAPMIRGTASFKLEAGEYTFEVMPMEGEFYYDKALCVLTAEEPEVTVSLCEYADETNKEEIYVFDTDGVTHVPYNAVAVGEGATYVKIDRPANTYFIFTPTRGGIYRISYEAKRAVTLGYYGSPHNVLAACPVEVKDGAFELEVKNEGVNIGNPGGTTQVVIGIRSFTEKGCILKIERIGNATVDLPWTDIQADRNAIKVDSYANSEFVDFDVTDSSLTVVYNEKDGYYHLNSVDGPVIYVRISSAIIESVTDTETIYKYLPSFVAMCETGRLGKVFYDEDGAIVKKESYNDLLYQYAELCGANGMYPLNKQLAEVIKNIGEHNSWFDLSSELHIFGDDAANIVKENAWLFACAYENQKALGVEGKPVALTPDSADSAKTYAVLLTKDESVLLRTITKATITVINAENVKIIANDGTEYVPEGADGTLSVLINANQNFEIIYTGESEETAVYFTFIA